jgi:outer membrane protein with beta-barrel domain
MYAQSIATAALALSLLAPSVATAQASQSLDRPTVVLFANGGGNSSLTDLNDAGTSSLKTGWTAGGGAGVQLNRYVALRGTFDFAQAKGDNGTAFSGQQLNHYFYGGDLQLRYPTASGLAPYVLLGAGAVTIDNPDNAAFDRFTKFAGKGGLGVEYTIPRSNFGLYAQASSYVYQFDRNGFDKTQADLLWTGGLSYRLPR